jgi:hypothetical protein
MKHWWQGWSKARSFLFCVLMILLSLLANGLANRTHSYLVQILVQIGGILLVLWAGRIYIWNLQHANDSPKTK